MLEENSDFTNALMCISPPTDPNCSDEDSGDENCGTADNLSRRQLEAEAQVTILKDCMQIRPGDDADEDDDDSADAESLSTSVCATTSMSLFSFKLASRPDESQSADTPTASSASPTAICASMPISPIPEHITSNDATGVRHSEMITSKRSIKTAAGVQEPIYRIRGSYTDKQRLLRIIHSISWIFDVTSAMFTTSAMSWRDQVLDEALDNQSNLPCEYLMRSELIVRITTSKPLGLKDSVHFVE